MKINDQNIWDQFTAEKERTGWNDCAVIDAVAECFLPAAAEDEAREAMRARIRGVVTAGLMNFGG